MTPEAFIAKWCDAELKERSAAQEHFIDLCRLLGEQTPAEADPKGEWYAFEFGAKKSGGGNGWADVWRRARFGWEYKGKGKSLIEALRQLLGYTPTLLYPPLLIVSDIETIEIHTAFPNTVSEKHVISLEDLRNPAKRQLLKWAFTDPEKLRPHRTRDDVTAEAAAKLGGLAEALRQRGHEPNRIAHFINQCLFCLYAEDVGLLPTKLFERIVEKSVGAPEKLTARLGELFQAMRSGGDFLLEEIAWFNGGLFERIDLVPLEASDIRVLRDATRMDWTAIEPAIFGTLFERGLDPAKRSQLGAHYTDPDSIMRIVRATIIEPLRAEWTLAKTIIQADQTKQRKKALAAYQGFLERLRNYRVLDPACGSGNFLYLALRALKDLELQVMLEAEALGLPRGFPQVGPECVLGIELNPYAAELARVTVWIGEIQWMLAHGFNANRNPVLRPLENIQERDAVLSFSPLPEGEGPGVRVAEPEWPEADAIIGNPPFLGDKKMLAELGEEYVTRLRGLYKGRVPGGADLVTYWFEKARAQIERGKAVRAGLVSTNSIRGGANRKVLERIKASGRIYTAWADEEWVNEGAAVRVSLVCFDGLRATSEPSPQTPPALIGLGGEGLQTEPSSGAVQPIAPSSPPSPRGGGAGGEGLPHPSQEMIDFARGLRRGQTDAETLMWGLLRAKRMCNRKFRRQHPVPPYVLDFYCHEIRLAVELDGGQHNEALSRRKDEARTRFLNELGIEVIRFWDNEVLQQTEAVMTAIYHRVCPEGEAALTLRAPSPQTPPPRGEGLQTEPSFGTVQPTAPSSPPSPRGGRAGGEGLNSCDRVRAEGEAELTLRAPSPQTPPPRGEGLQTEPSFGTVQPTAPSSPPSPRRGGARGEGLNTCGQVRAEGEAALTLRAPSPQTPPPRGEGLQTEPSFGTVQPTAPSSPPSPRGGGAGGEGLKTRILLDGREVAEIYADLTGPAYADVGADLTQAKPLPDNARVGFVGGMKKGPFDIPGELARSWLNLPNPNAQSNRAVVLPWCNGLDVTRRPSDTWIVDFGVNMPEEDAALFEAPFHYVEQHVRPQREETRNPLERSRWWLHARSAPDLRKAIAKVERFIATPRVSKHRLFVWIKPPVVCDGQLVIIARSDDTTFGILHSRFHELWALRMGTSLEDRPRYTPTTTFETFPFPAGLTPNRKPEEVASALHGSRDTNTSCMSYANPHSEAIAQAARRLTELRENWLNPPEWVERVPEIIPGLPDRLIPKPAHEAELKKRTLTNLYNQRPAWLAKAHQTLDAAVAAAYGWPTEVSEGEILRRLLTLNRERAVLPGSSARSHAP